MGKATLTLISLNLILISCWPQENGDCGTKECFIDGQCYREFQVNPKNRSLACDPQFDTNSWIEASEVVLENWGRRKTYAVSMDACIMSRGIAFSGMTGEVTNAYPPPPNGLYGLNFSSAGASYSRQGIQFPPLSYAFALTFYVNFQPHVQSPSGNTTFFEIGSFIKIQRRPDDLLQVVYNFTNLNSGAPVVKTIILQDDEDRDAIAKDLYDGWIQVGLGYDVHIPQLVFYLNGRLLKKDVDISGLQLLFSGDFVMKISGVSISCIDGNTIIADMAYYNDHTECKVPATQYKSYIESCEKAVFG